MERTRVTLRPISLGDLPHCTRWAGDPKVMQHVTQKTFTPEQEREWLEGILRSDQEKVYVILKEEQIPIGTCGIHFSSKNPDLRDEEGLSLGIMIGEKAEWGKGYGPEALHMLADIANEQYGANRVWLTVDSVHARAIRAYEKAGFSVVREIAVPDRVHSDGKQLLMEIRFNSAPDIAH